MKQTFKRFLGLMLVCLMVFSTSISVLAAHASVEVSDDVKQSLIENTEGILNEVAALDEQSMAALEQQNSAFLGNVVEAWRSNGNELGGFVEMKNSEVSYDGSMYTIDTVAVFEKNEAEVTITVDNSFQPQSFGLTIQYPLSVTMKNAALNTVMGIGTVFIMLLALSGIISLFVFINRPSKKKEDKIEVETPAIVTDVIEETDFVDDLELVAVITAAIAASENQSTDSFVVRSIKRAENKKWQRA